MLKNIQHKQKLIFILTLVLVFASGNFALAFEKFGPLKKQCRSTCHQAEHIKQSRKDKLSKPECRTCHSGIESPFSSPQKSFTTVGNGLLLKSLVQPVPSKSKKELSQTTLSKEKEMALIPNYYKIKKLKRPLNF